MSAFGWFRKLYLFPNIQSWLPLSEPCSDHLFSQEYWPAFLMSPLPQFPSLQTQWAIQCMPFTNKEYFPVSEVFLHLEIPLAVLNKIPPPRFGACNLVSGTHHRISFYPSLCSWHCAMLNCTLFPPTIICFVSSNRKNVCYFTPEKTHWSLTLTNVSPWSF